VRPLPRLAWFSPLPPVRSGISAYSAELLPKLAAAYDIDVFVDRASSRAGLKPSPAADVGPCRDVGLVGIRSYPSYDFVARHAVEPYDLVVYQLGNATCHDYMWPYLLRYPGLVVLHDAALHHARARSLLSRNLKDDYRAEFKYAHPQAPADAAEFAVAGFAGPLYYLWPHTRIPVESARLVAVHSAPLAEALGEEFSDRKLRTIRMGVKGTDGLRSAGGARESGTGEPSDSSRPGPTFMCFGLVTPEKRIEQILRAFKPVTLVSPSAHLFLVGDVPGYYDVHGDIARVGLGDRVTVTGFVPDEAIATWLMRADVCLCLRWPSGGETSASWLRCLAAGKATIVTDLKHTIDVPVIDPRTWTVAHARTDAAAAQSPPDARQAVAVAIDILDEDHSLGLGLNRLAVDRPLRDQLGRNAYNWWHAHHTLEAMVRDYHEAIAEAIRTPPPAHALEWPRHLLDDGGDLARRLAAEFGVTVDILAGG
jgi:glycosyltransferase involved in cell wall biosynthesis